MTETILLLRKSVLSKMSHESELSESEFYYTVELSDAELLHQSPTHSKSKERNLHMQHSWQMKKLTTYSAARIKLLVRIWLKIKLSFRSFYVFIYCLKARVSIVRKTMARNHRRAASSPSAKFKYLRKRQVLQTLSLWGRVL